LSSRGGSHASLAAGSAAVAIPRLSSIIFVVIKAALIQGESQGNPKANLEYYTERVRVAVDAETKLVVLPELVFTDYFPIVEDMNNFKLAMTLDAPEVRALVDLAAELKITLTIPFYEKRSEGVYHNSMLVAEPDGSVSAHYRKMHIPDDPGFYEKYYFIPGDKGFVVADSAAGKLGLLICWDQWFPEAARLNTLKGAQVLIYPTAIGFDHSDAGHGCGDSSLRAERSNPLSQWIASSPSAPRNDDAGIATLAAPAQVRDTALAKSQLDAWVTSMRAHAIHNGIHVIAVNRVGMEGHLEFWGNSFCADPFGNVLARAGMAEETLYVDLDYSKTRSARHSWPYLRDRRIDHYGDLLKIWAE